MYSIILLTALSTGADVTPPAPAAMAAPVSSGCCGVSTGCCGYSMAYSSCYGCCGGSCHGSCHGGLFHGRGLFSHHSSCHGYSCCGGYSCSGCCGGYACSGCSGSTWGPPIGMPPYTLQGYNQGGMYGYGQPVIWGTVTNTNPPTMTAPVIPPAVPASDAKPSGTTPTETKKSPGMGANLKFTVPTATKLYIDGQLTSASGTERLFSTPPLAVGQKFYYDVKAELSVNGTAVVQEMRVIVESGANINESFGKLFAAVQDPNAVAGK